MQYFAHVVDGVVREVQQIPADANVAECFQAEFVAQLTACDDTVEQGWTYASGRFAAPVAPTPTVQELMAYANEKQWALATGGYTMTFGGQALQFASDPTSQALITGKWARFQAPNPPVSVDWQFGAAFVTLTSADFEAAATAIADFVQATFDALKAVFAAIETATVTSFEEVDAWAWPANHAA